MSTNIFYLFYENVREMAIWSNTNEVERSIKKRDEALSFFLIDLSHLFGCEFRPWEIDMFKFFILVDVIVFEDGVNQVFE